MPLGSKYPLVQEAGGKGLANSRAQAGPRLRI